MPLFWSPAGELIEDEPVEFLNSFVDDGTTYYYGFLSNWADKVLADGTQGVCGVYTAVELGGSRKDVLLEGLPSSTSEVVVKITEGGKVIARENTLLYFTYYGHGEIVWYPKKIVHYPGVTKDETKDLVALPVAKNMLVSAFTCKVDSWYVPDAQITLQLRTGLAGTGDTVDLDLGVVSAVNRVTKLKFFATPIQFNTNDYFVIRGNAKGCGDFYFEFF